MERFPLLPCSARPTAAVRRALGLAALVAVIAAAAPVPARALSLEGLRSKGFGSVPLRVVGHNVLAVDVEINGRRERLVVDTGYGGPGILLHDSVVAEIGLPAAELRPVGESLHAAHGTAIGGVRQGRAQRLRLGNVELTDVPLLFVGNRFAFRGSGGKGEGDGFIGAGFLSACGAVLDLQNAVMYLHAPGRGSSVDLGPALRAAGMTETPLDYRAGAGLTVKTKLNGADARMVVDTGASMTVVDPEKVPGLKAARWNSRWQMNDAGGTASRSQLAVLDDLRIGDHRLRTTDVRFTSLTLSKEGGPDAPAGLLGPDQLGRNGAIINCGTRRLYLIPGDR